jgi:transglutaminase-like putative cysteine protease
MTRLGPAYAAFAAAYLFAALVAMRVHDPARAQVSQLEARQRAAFVIAVVSCAAFALGISRALPPLHDRVQREIENKFVMHDMVGFGQGASLDELHDMIESDVEVLRVKPPRATVPVDYLRGAVYDQFNVEQALWGESPQRTHEVQLGADVAPAGTAVRIHRVAGTPGRYFLPLGARDLKVVAGAVLVDNLGAVFTVGHEATSDYSFQPGERDKLTLRPPIWFDVQVPKDEREVVGRLAQEWTAGAATDAQKLDAIEAHLHKGYAYSLSVPRGARGDALLGFLLDVKVGYCTYFASAMVVLARAAGVPARLATGYRVAEWSPVSGEYIVREKNAHAWVEAWVDGAWRTYDPTPAAELPQDRAHTASFAILVTDALNRLEVAVSYGLTHVTPAQLFAALTVLGLLWFAVRRWNERVNRGAKGGRAAEADLPLPCFVTLAAWLEGRGVGRELAEPLGGFARRLEERGLPEAAILVERYAALRYGGVGDVGALQRDVERLVRA